MFLLQKWGLNRGRRRERGLCSASVRGGMGEGEENAGDEEAASIGYPVMGEDGG